MTVIVSAAPEATEMTSEITLVRAMDLTSDMDIIVPYRGVVALSHTRRNGNQVHVTNNYHDTDVVAPIFTFDELDPVSVLINAM